MDEELKKLYEKVKKFNEQAKKEGTAISEEELKKIWPKGGIIFEPGNFGGILKKKKKKE